ncbi:hypothetical protein RV15_GL002820 [Enterococcus silesiacus]|nr:hypothetical protein RV15_GL002820 [Enterococcus silesiacus]
MIITNLFLSCLAISAGLLLSNQVFAAPVETSNTQENIIAKSSQQLSQLKETKQHFSNKKKTNDTQVSTIEKRIKIIQLDLDQLEKIKTAGSISNSASSKEDQTISMIPDSSTVTLKADPIVEKKEQLTELRQKQDRLKEDNQSLVKQQSEVAKQETQLSEKITLVKKQQEEQTKKMDTSSTIVAAAKTHLGKPYVYGAAGPDTFDCSGLVQVAFTAAGRSIGRTTVDQESAGATISVSEAQAGDLVFWGSHGSTHHVGISLGDGTYIHAPVPGDVVQVATVASYTPDFAVRVL